MFVHIPTLTLPIFTVNLTNTNRRPMSITLFKAASHARCSHHSNVYFSLEDPRYTCIYANRKRKAVEFTACSPETCLNHCITAEKWGKSRSAGVPGCPGLCFAAAGRWVLGSAARGFSEAQKPILLFRYHPVIGGKLVCLKYTYSQNKTLASYTGYMYN